MPFSWSTLDPKGVNQFVSNFNGEEVNKKEFSQRTGSITYSCEISENKGSIKKIWKFKMARFFQMVFNFPDGFKNVRIFPDHCHFPDDFKTIRMFPDAKPVWPNDLKHCSSCKSGHKVKVNEMIVNIMASKKIVKIMQFISYLLFALPISHILIIP